jgi:hypothetical protein
MLHRGCLWIPGPATQVGSSRLGQIKLPISGKPEIGGRPGMTKLHRPREEGHAVLVVADIARSALRRKARVFELLQHRGLGVMR